MSDDVKKIVVIPEQKEETKKKRKVTQEARWRHSAEVGQLMETLAAVLQGDMGSKVGRLILSQVGQKVAGYRGQDCHKGMDVTAVLTTLDAIKVLHDCGMKCHYCDGDMRLLYEQVRDPMQWSLDRIDNAAGHTVDNVYAACLSCNLRRKTIHHDRFYFTKQVRWIKE